MLKAGLLFGVCAIGMMLGGGDLLLTESSPVSWAVALISIFFGVVFALRAWVCFYLWKHPEGR